MEIALSDDYFVPRKSGGDMSTAADTTATAFSLSSGLSARRIWPAHATPRRLRSRSSPIRTGVSGGSSPRQRARSPSTSALRSPAAAGEPATAALALAPTALITLTSLYKYISGCGTVAYFSPLPPAAPLHLVHLGPSASVTPTTTQPPRTQKKNKRRNKKAVRVVRNILHLIISELPLDENAQHTPMTEITPSPGPTLSSSRSIAIQTKPKRAINRSNIIQEQQSSTSSSGEECMACEGWADDVRALRESHVRLVLRQLRQLRDIERLSRALHRPRHAHDHAHAHGDTTNTLS